MATNNRFKKSVEKATDNTSEIVSSTIKESATYDIKENTPSNISNNILCDILKSSKKDRGKSHTIYLSAEVSDALDNQAKQSKMSKSELVDKVLRRVLLNR